MFCPRCGNNNDNNARFCFSCGQRFQQGNQPAGPSGPNWGQFQDPAPAPAPAPQPAAPPSPPPRAVHTQIVAGPPPPVKRGNPALAVAVIAGLAIVVGAVFFVTRDNNKSSGGVLGGGNGQVITGPIATKPPAGQTPSASPVPSINDGPIVAPGYKMTAIFVPPPGATDQKGLEPRLFDALVAGVDWNDSAKLYGRRYPLQYVFNNATTNLLLKPPNADQAKRLLAAAGYSVSKPKFLLTYNPTDRVFGVWLEQQLTALGYNVVTDANNFSAEEKSRGYHGLIIAILPA